MERHVEICETKRSPCIKLTERISKGLKMIANMYRKKVKDGKLTELNANRGPERGNRLIDLLIRLYSIDPFGYILSTNRPATTEHNSPRKRSTRRRSRSSRKTRKH